MAKKLLIVSHTFPPASGIGGRRWAKFVKYLKRKGYDITVISAQPVEAKESVWVKDVEGIDVMHLPYKFPKTVAFPKNDLFSKFLYYLNLNLLKLRDNGNYFDKSVFWKKQIQNKITEVIEAKKINCVIVTSGPFRISNYVMNLTQKFPDVKFIADFRDLWTEDKEITSFAALPLCRIKVEKKLERETVYLADKIISVAPELNDYFNSLTINNKFDVIPNGYDPEDFENIKPETKTSSAKIKFVFTGTLYINLNYIIEPFINALAQLKESYPELYGKLEFEFIGRFPEKYLELIRKNKVSEIFKVSESLALKEVYSKINNADYCMLFLNDIYNFALSTKFCEYISQKKKIIIVSNKGPAVEFITKNEIGYWINPEFAFPDLKELITLTVDKNFSKWNSNFNTEAFSIPSITEKLVNVIEEKHRPHSSAKKRHLLLTFDYELFLGKRSGSVENCIIKPTEFLLNIFKQHNVSKTIFFADSTYLKKLSESNEKACQNDLQKIRTQLVRILKDGHYVFPHLHPHWRDAVYHSDINQWTLENSLNYRLHVIPEEERRELFQFSINFLKGIMEEANVEYEIDSYRAGGWCIQPFSEIKIYFEKFGLKNDFSALRGFKMVGKYINYDFLNIPLKNIYSFSNEVETEDKSGKFHEIVISNLLVSNLSRFLNKFLIKFLWFTKQRNFGDGISAVDGETGIIRSIQNMEKNTLNRNEMVSIELLTYFTNRTYKKHLDENDFMHFISHPKMISKHNLNMLNSFLKYAGSKYDLNYDYKKMLD